MRRSRKNEIGLLREAKHLGMEAQGFLLVADVNAGHFDFHLVSPLSRSRFVPHRLLLSGNDDLVQHSGDFFCFYGEPPAMHAQALACVARSRCQKKYEIPQSTLVIEDGASAAG